MPQHTKGYDLLDLLAFTPEPQDAKEWNENGARSRMYGMGINQSCRHQPWPYQ